MTERHVSRMPSVSEEEARAILARHGMAWDGPIPVHTRPNNHDLGYRAMDFNDGHRRVFVQGGRAVGRTQAMEAIRQFYETDLTPFYQRLQEAVGEVMVTVRNVHYQLREAGLIADAPPDDPKARALWAAKNRNTGPARPSAAQARRPRRHQ